MKKLNTSAISTTNAMPLKAGSLVHVQSAYQEIFSEVVKKMSGDGYSASTAYRLNGLVNTGGSVTAGSLFYNGEVYLVDAFTLPSPANAYVDTTYFTSIAADPVDFTDGTPRSVHEINKVKFGTPPAAGLGFSFSQIVELGAYNWNIDNSSGTFNIFFDKPSATFRSFVVSGGTSLTINLDGTGARDGVESVCMFQISTSSISFTINTINGAVDLIGIGGYSNPLVMSVASTKYFVFRFKCFNPPPLGGANSVISLTVTEHT